MKSKTFRLSSVDICRYSYRVAFMLTGRLFVLSDYSQRAEVNEERESSAAAGWKEEEVSYVHLTECCDSFDELRWHKQKGVIAITGEWVSECECECEWASVAAPRARPWTRYQPETSQRRAPHHHHTPHTTHNTAPCCVRAVRGTRYACATSLHRPSAWRKWTSRLSTFTPNVVNISILIIHCDEV